MVVEDIHKEIKHIEIYTKRLVDSLIAGKYLSVFKGGGIEFFEVKKYQEGDDFRSINWHVTARRGMLFTKKFVEERELTLMLLVDGSSSGRFGTAEQMKEDVIVKVCATLAFSAVGSNDKAGLIIFTDKVERFIPPKRGKNQARRIIFELLSHALRRGKNLKTNISSGLAFFGKRCKGRNVAVLISDFLDDPEEYAVALRSASRRYDLIPIVVRDPREVELPKIGFLRLHDAETGEKLLIDTSDEKIHRQFSERISEEIIERERLFASLEVDYMEMMTNSNYLFPLIDFFKKRAKRHLA